MLPSDHETLDPQRPVIKGWPCVLGSHVSNSNGYLRNTGRSVGPHRTRPVLNRLKLREVCKLSGSPNAKHWTVRCSPDSYPERFAKTRGHQSQNTGRCGGINPYTLTTRIGPGGLAHYETSLKLDPTAWSFAQGNKT